MKHPQSKFILFNRTIQHKILKQIIKQDTKISKIKYLNRNRFNQNQDNTINKILQKYKIRIHICVKIIMERRSNKWIFKIIKINIKINTISTNKDQYIINNITIKSKEHKILKTTKIIKVLFKQKMNKDRLKNKFILKNK